MKRPLLFAAECAAGLLIATSAAVVADRFSRKSNRMAQAGERIAAALERASDAAERLADAEERRPMECRDNRGNLTPCPRHVLPRPSLLHHVDLKPIPKGCEEGIDGILVREVNGKYQGCFDAIKPIPPPNPEPCGDEMAVCHQTAFSFFSVRHP